MAHRAWGGGAQKSCWSEHFHGSSEVSATFGLAATNPKVSVNCSHNSCHRVSQHLQWRRLYLQWRQLVRSQLSEISCKVLQELNFLSFPMCMCNGP